MGAKGKRIVLALILTLGVAAVAAIMVLPFRESVTRPVATSEPHKIFCRWPDGHRTFDAAESVYYRYDTKEVCDYRWGWRLDINGYVAPVQAKFCSTKVERDEIIWTNKAGTTTVASVGVCRDLND